MNGHGASRWKWQAIAMALAAEHPVQDDAQRPGDVGLAWHHRERAHIFTQARLFPHIGSHWRMLVLALVQRDA